MNLITAILGRAIKPLYNIGLGRIPGVHSLYKVIWRHFGPQGIRLTEVDGFKVYVICRDWAVSPTMLFSHVWEPAEAGIFRQHIKKGMTVVDAGAYIGYFSLLASKLVGEKGKVYAFEPSLECLGLLHLNIRTNKCRNIQVFGKAVADKSGETTLYVSPQNLSASSISRSVRTWRQIQVPAITLDEAVSDRRVDFVKMDIEGGETKAFKGMARIIHNSADLKMIIEVSSARLVEVGSNLGEYIGFLLRYFHLYIIGKNGLTSEVGLSGIERAVRKFGVINLFCQRRGDYV